MIEISRIVSNDILTPIELAPHIIAVVVCQKASEVVGMLRNVDTRLPLFLKRVKKVEVNYLNGDNEEYNYVTEVNEYKQAKIIETEEKNNNYGSSIPKPEKNKKNQRFVYILLCREYDIYIVYTVKNLLKDMIIHVKTRLIPVNPPYTSEQYKEWSQHWPIIFTYSNLAKPILHCKIEEELLRGLALYHKGAPVLFDNSLLMVAEGKSCQKGTIAHAIMYMLYAWPVSYQYQKAEVNKYYYLRNLRLLVSTKLCGMCSMALVHSRLYRIYFLVQDTPNRIEFEKEIEYMSRILSMPKSNHHVYLFKIMLK